MTRSGAALLELIAATALLGVIGASCAALLHAQAKLLHNTAEHAAADETFRTARAVLAAELRPLVPADLRAVARDSIALRVFRGWGIVCARRDPHVAMRYHGVRLPDAEKDSLLVSGEDRIGVFQASADATLRCTPRTGEELVVIAPAITLQPGSIALFFESGAYHIATNAVRYRRGGEGRQPLTDELIDDRRSRFDRERNDRGVRMRLTASARARQQARTSEVRMSYVNQR